MYMVHYILVITCMCVSMSLYHFPVVYCCVWPVTYIIISVLSDMGIDLIFYSSCNNNNNLGNSNCTILHMHVTVKT